MLSSIFDAVSVKGRSNIAIARNVGKTAQTVSFWFNGRVYIPPRSRKSLCEAIGAEIDWDAYETEFAEYQETRPAKAPALPRASTPAEDRSDPAPVPETPRSAPVTPATPPRRITATPPAQRAARASAPPASASARKGGLLGFLFDNDPNDNGMKFA